MQVYRSVRSLAKKVSEIKKRNNTIGLVPTMGFLHEGHASLIRKAGKDADCVIVSIFVNPAQFGPGEDFKKYPRNLKRDLEICKIEGADIIFVPKSKDMYPEGYSTYINVEGVTEKLCGVSRPGHFLGVTTVVAKLFNIAMPDIAYFGQKDAQQAIVIKKMALDLNMGVKIKVMPIIREKDGLAMSSRNVYLSSRERAQAVSLYKSLMLAKRLFSKGERDSGKIISKMKEVMSREPDAKIDYIAIVDTKELKDIKKISGTALAAIAARIGNTRLIDNVILN